MIKREKTIESDILDYRFLGKYLIDTKDKLTEAKASAEKINPPVAPDLIAQIDGALGQINELQRLFAEGLTRMEKHPEARIVLRLGDSTDPGKLDISTSLEFHPYVNPDTLVDSVSKFQAACMKAKATGDFSAVENPPTLGILGLHLQCLSVSTLDDGWEGLFEALQAMYKAGTTKGFGANMSVEGNDDPEPPASADGGGDKLSQGTYEQILDTMLARYPHVSDEAREALKEILKRISNGLHIEIDYCDKCGAPYRKNTPHDCAK